MNTVHIPTPEHADTFGDLLAWPTPVTNPDTIHVGRGQIGDDTYLVIHRHADCFKRVFQRKGSQWLELPYRAGDDPAAIAIVRNELKAA